MSSYGVKSHRLFVDGASVDFCPTPNRSGTMIPSVVVLHDTAGRLDHESSVDWLCSKAAKASAHLVIGRGGEIVQLAAFNVATWHAGVSSYRGRSGVNAFGIGIEIVNPGRLASASGADGGRAWFGEVFPRSAFQLEYRETREHGEGLWMEYTAAQVAAVTGICSALAGAYGIEAITTHWEISPGRKFDTNPLFPLAALRAHVFGNGPGATADRTDAVTTVGVNQRRWPSLADNILRVLPAGTRVRTIRTGLYAAAGPDARWHLVEAPGLGEGWVLGVYLDLD